MHQINFVLISYCIDDDLKEKYKQARIFSEEGRLKNQMWEKLNFPVNINIYLLI